MKIDATPIRLLLLTLWLCSACSQREKILYTSIPFTLYSDAMVEGDFKAVATSPYQITTSHTTPAPLSTLIQEEMAEDNDMSIVPPRVPTHTDSMQVSGWEAVASLESYPHYHSPQLLLDALYNYSLDKLSHYVLSNGTFSSMEGGGAISTSHLNYALDLSLLFLLPEVAMKSLKSKVREGRIVQDDLTGEASWPIASDRVAWSVAAWELYKYTGNQQWLSYAFEVIQNSAIDDRYVVYDPHTGLMRGQQSGNGTFPRWMQPIDRYQTLGLTTNVLHCRMYEILSKMAPLLSIDATPYIEQHYLLKEAINQHLWVESRGYYASYLYGNIYPLHAPTCDNLGGALSLLYGITTPQQATSMVTKTPILPMGVPTSYPIMPTDTTLNIRPYVQAYWALASAKANNEMAVSHTLATLYRDLSHSVATKGEGERAITCVASNLAMVYRLIFGMSLKSNALRFDPYVPTAYEGKRRLTHFKYRDATLDITLHGFGNWIATFKVDGRAQVETQIPCYLKGRHRIEITLANRPTSRGEIHVDSLTTLPPATQLVAETPHREVRIANFTPPLTYRPYLNEVVHSITGKAQFQYPQVDSLLSIAVEPITPQGVVGFSGAPLVVVAPEGEQVIKVGQPLTASSESVVKLPIHLTQKGLYLVDIHYSNNEAGANCAIRTLLLNNHWAGGIVMPPNGVYSNPIELEIVAGNHTLTLCYVEPYDHNGDGGENRVWIEHIRIREVMRE